MENALIASAHTILELSCLCLVVRKTPQSMVAHLLLELFALVSMSHPATFRNVKADTARHGMTRQHTCPWWPLCMPLPRSCFPRRLCIRACS